MKMSDDDLWAYQNKAASYARRHEADMETARDFASYCTVRVLEGGPTVFKWLWADFWRKEIHRPVYHWSKKLPVA